MELSFLTHALIVSLSKTSRPSGESGDTISISRTVSALALLYERIRVAIEYREDHLLRRAAIERIIKRRLILNENGRGIAEYLLKELLWAKYLPEDSVPVYKINEVQTTVDKFIFLRNELTRGRALKEQTELSEWLISSAAAEVEQKLVPSQVREAFINFIFKYYQTRVFLKDETDRTKDIQVYIAVHRAFAKSDNDFIRYELLKLSLPAIQNATWKELKDQTQRIYQTLQNIQKHLTHKLGGKLAKSLKKEIAPFLILRELYEENPNEFEKILSDPKLVEQRVDTICRRRYEAIGRRLVRAGTRSIIYIFITKMLFAFALEYPYEKYYLTRVNYISLTINTVFPPILMFLVLIGVSAPGEDNTKRIVSRIKDIVYHGQHDVNKISLALTTPQRRPVLLFIFSLVYTATFLLVFGSISVGLTLLHFSITSQLVFIFFVSVVLFFAYRVRQTGKEYNITQKESFLSPVISFVLLPILNVGKWLSNEIARFNFFVALFDFVIEAPFKAIFEIFEEWFAFLRRKKEEIL